MPSLRRFLVAAATLSLLLAVPARGADVTPPAAVQDLGFGTGAGHVTVYGPNPRYLQDASGTPFAIVGFGNEGRNTPAVIAQLAGKINYQRAYATSWDSGRSPDEYALGRPWPTVNGKTDMSTWNETYWSNLRDNLGHARDAGIVVGLTLWDGHDDLPGGKFGNASIWNASLNAQGVQWAYDDAALAQYPNPSPNGGASEKLVYYQRRWIDRLLQEIAAYPNVIIELDNETDTAPTAWWLWWAGHVRAAGSYIVATTWQPSATIPDNVFSSDARLDMKSYHQRDESILTAQRWAWNKIIVVDADEACTNLDRATGRGLAWRSLLRGGHWNDFVCIDTAFPDAAKIQDYGHLLDFLRTRNVALWSMAPHTELVSSGVAMAAVGTSYLVYTTANVTVDLSGAAGTLNWTWYDPSLGVDVSSGQVAGGAPRAFTLPGAGDFVLWIRTGAASQGARRAGSSRRTTPGR
ncbi:MAG: hypothetical protein HYR74_05080 [Candidatus Eisenbacteria bacterium]|nr:hypothetical protein [Candidatus Eisenbacteria bacterium]